MFLINGNRTFGFKGRGSVNDSVKNKIKIDSNTSVSVGITPAMTQRHSMPSLLKMTRTSNLLDIIRRHTLRYTPFFDIRPSISSVFIYKHKPFPFTHAPLCIAS